MQSSSNAYACIAPEVHDERPTTPEHLRSRHRGPPGKIEVHRGLIGQRLPPKEFRYGIAGDRSEQVATLIAKPPKSNLEEYIQDERERLYKSHIMKPLGKTHGHLMKLPEKTKAPDFAFGVSSGKLTDTKQLMYPDHSNRELRKEYYHRKAVEPPGKLRETIGVGSNYYDWKSIGKDPTTFVFGHSKTVTDTDGVADAMNCSLADPTKSGSIADKKSIRSLNRTEMKRIATEPLGRVRDLPDAVRDLGSNFVFGKPDAVDEWGAGRTLKGEYSAEEQAPDRDLDTIGKRDRYRNPLTGKYASPGHSYGKPSIRRNKEPPTLRSLADNTNYGDEHDAHGLLYPSKFSSIGINEREFDEERTENEIREIFSALECPDHRESEVERVMAKIKSTGDMLTIRTFHSAMAQIRNGSQ